MQGNNEIMRAVSFCLFMHVSVVMPHIREIMKSYIQCELLLGYACFCCYASLFVVFCTADLKSPFVIGEVDAVGLICTLEEKIQRKTWNYMIVANEQDLIA